VPLQLLNELRKKSGHPGP